MRATDMSFMEKLSLTMRALFKVNVIGPAVGAGLFTLLIAGTWFPGFEAVACVMGVLWGASYVTRMNMQGKDPYVD